MKKIKYYILIVIGIFAFGSLVGQNSPSDLWLNANTDDFATIRQNVENYYADKDKGRGSGYKQWKRWEFINKNRLSNDGKVINYTARNFNEYQNYISANSSRGTHHGYWESKGPTEWVDGFGWNGGLGRVNCITFHPTDASTYWVGTPAGGLWKTEDYAASWTPLTDGMPRIGVSDMVVDYSNTDILYLLTGDGDGGDVKSIGVLKTTDGGETWFNTGLSYTVTQSKRMYKLIMHPTDHTILFAVGTDGILKTTNSGATWTNVLSGVGTVYDIEFKPGSPSIMYACTNSEFYRSTNTGASWTQITSGVPTNASRMAIGVTVFNSSYVYLLAGPSPSTGTFVGMYRSYDSGVNFSVKSTTPNILGYSSTGNDAKSQTTYDLALVISKDDESDMITGGINTWKSTDWGANWTNLSVWNNPPGVNYTHADIHALEQNPLTGTVYCGSDGGLFYSADFGENWYDITAGLAITQNYRIAGYEADQNLIINGTQDNGSNKWTGGSTMLHTVGADGFDCMIDYNNSDILYNTTQSELYKSTDGGASYTNIRPAGSAGGGLIPLVMDAISSTTIYAGYSDIFKSTNGGSTWTNLGYNGTGAMALGGTSNHNRVYACADFSKTIYMSNDGGASFITRTGLPAGTVTYIAVNPSNSYDVFVTYGGYTAGRKVFRSTDAGATWTNISGTLPNIPINCIAYESTGGTPNDALYIGTDVGVYYRDDDLGDWIPFMNGLPATMVFDLEINETNKVIMAGTHGRGFWRSLTYGDCDNALTLNQANDPSNPNYTGFQYYEANNYVTSSRIITGGIGTDVTYQAGSYVLLQTDFHAQAGNLFVAKLGPCVGGVPPVHGQYKPVTGIYVGAPIYGDEDDNSSSGSTDWTGIGENNSKKLVVNIYPNPFSGSITIEYGLKQTGNVKILIYNHLGKEIEKVVKENSLPGEQHYVWNSSGFASGIYFVKVLAGQLIVTKKIVKIR